MANGFEINITEHDFKAKSPEDRTWILFQGVILTNKLVTGIDKGGCEFSKSRHKYNLRWTLSAMTGSIVFALGIVYIIYQLTCK